jgi:hypothetical protein
MRRAGAAVLMSGLLSIGCNSVEWREGAPPDVWRGATVRSAEVARVAAKDEADAADVYHCWAAVRAAMANAGVTPPSPPLLLAVNAADELLLTDALSTTQAIARWHQQHVTAGTPEAPNGVTTIFSAPDLPPDVLALLARAAAGAVPLAAPELALPAAWQQGATWGVVLPTTATSDAAADLVLEYGMTKADLSFGEQLLAAPMMPFLRSAARGQLYGLVQSQVLDAALAVSRREGNVPANARAQCRRELGIDTQPDPEPPFSANATSH